jgi:phosphoenolpyruvate carboxykinase (ATP)
MENGLEAHGIRNVKAVHWNLPTSALYEQIVSRGEGLIAHLGPMVVRTGVYTGRSPRDKFIVKEPSSAHHISWGPENQPLELEKFDLLHYRLLAFLQGKEIFVQDCYAGADPTYRLSIRIITTQAWQNLFARNLFVQIRDQQELAQHAPEFTIISAPEFHAVPELDGTNSEAFIIVNFARKLILIGGTSYAGEIKKSVFTILHYYLPQKEVLSMHCSANEGQNGDTALFFGLSGTGKTSLSADPARKLIGDDEHGWGKGGIFNFEGGCYAKGIRLSPRAEPEIYECTRRFGTILENVGIDLASRRLDLDDDSLTENTRAAYPIRQLTNVVPEGVGGHPRAAVMLTADAFGVLPPVARLSPAQAMYYFMSGYTAKVAGTERGITEPQATFSACFGAPFMPLHPGVYAGLLGERLRRHGATTWLVNTGWTGGPYGVGHRISIAYSRAVVRAALSGALDTIEYDADPVFGFQVPRTCPDVPGDVLDPARTWSDPAGHRAAAERLARRFVTNFAQFKDQAPAEVSAAGPRPD